MQCPLLVRCFDPNEPLSFPQHPGETHPSTQAMSFVGFVPVVAKKVVLQQRPDPARSWMVKRMIIPHPPVADEVVTQQLATEGLVDTHIAAAVMLSMSQMDLRAEILLEQSLTNFRCGYPLALAFWDLESHFLDSKIA